MRIVIKLGSNVTADDSGALRAAVLARLCDVLAERHAAGDSAVVVTRGVRLMLPTDLDGLFTADPRRDAGAELVAEVTDFEGLHALEIGHGTSPLGTGGMRSKIVAAEMSTAAGIPAVICNGLRPGAL